MKSPDRTAINPPESRNPHYFYKPDETNLPYFSKMPVQTDAGSFKNSHYKAIFFALSDLNPGIQTRGQTRHFKKALDLYDHKTSETV